jgi:hypothetical protein
MKRATFTLAALFLAGVALAADDQEQTGGPTPKPVVVDPTDLRQPVADPEKGLTEKYDGKQVRFTGQVQGSGQDAGTRATWYNLQVELPRVAQNAKKTANAKKGAKEAMDLVVVKVYLQQPDKRLRAAPARAGVTVVGKGQITPDGSLIIRDAEVMKLDNPKR